MLDDQLDFNFDVHICSCGAAYQGEKLEECNHSKESEDNDRV